MKDFFRKNKRELLSAAVIIGVFMLSAVSVLVMSAFEQTVLF